MATFLMREIKEGSLARRATKTLPNQLDMSSVMDDIGSFSEPGESTGDVPFL
jgi:hypothetical protein